MTNTNMRCGFAGDRDDTLIAYLYDDIEPGVRAAFDAHLTACAQCRDELAAMRGVRTTLARWNPPELKSLGANQPTHQSPWWRQIPAWAQVAAALLFLGVSAGIANLDVRYDSNGLVIRTGWASPPGRPVASTATPQPSAAQPSSALLPSSAAPSSVAQGLSPASKADLAALAQQLRAELRTSSSAGAANAAGRAASSDAEILRKVRALIDETERRQQRELALRLAQALSDVNAQRQADLRRIDVSLNGVQNSLGVEVLKQRRSLNYLMQVNQRQ